MLQVAEALKALFNTVSQMDSLPDFRLVQVTPLIALYPKHVLSQGL